MQRGSCAAFLHGRVADLEAEGRLEVTCLSEACHAAEGRTTLLARWQATRSSHSSRDPRALGSDRPPGGFRRAIEAAQPYPGDAVKTGGAPPWRASHSDAIADSLGKQVAAA